MDRNRDRWFGIAEDYELIFCGAATLALMSPLIGIVILGLIIAPLAKQNSVPRASFRQKGMRKEDLLGLFQGGPPDWYTELRV
jgi:hypothetical protein